jgi:hypothetical protein
MGKHIWKMQQHHSPVISKGVRNPYGEDPFFAQLAIFDQVIRDSSSLRSSE